MEIEELQSNVGKLKDDRDGLRNQLDETLLEVNDFKEEKLEEVDQLEGVVEQLENELENTKSKLEDARSKRESQRNVAHAATRETSNNKSSEKAESSSGAAPNVETTPSDSKGSMVGVFRATAYAVGDSLTPGTVTANGTDVSSTIYSPEGYRIIAADTSVIPMNSIVRVELPNGDSFKAKVSDTGSAINGNIVDILMPSPEEALRFGRQNGIKIYLNN